MRWPECDQSLWFLATFTKKSCGVFRSSLGKNKTKQTKQPLLLFSIGNQYQNVPLDFSVRLESWSSSTGSGCTVRGLVCSFLWLLQPTVTNVAIKTATWFFCSSGGQKSKVKVSAAPHSHQKLLGRIRSLPLSFCWHFLTPSLQSLPPSSPSHLPNFPLPLWPGYKWLHLGPSAISQNKCLLSRSLTSSHVLPYEVIFTGSGD